MWIIENIIATIITDFVVEYLKFSYQKLLKMVMEINRC